jgi:outer membrane receptor protein involved in Fe transport
MKRFLLALLAMGVLAVPPSWAQEAQQPAGESEEDKTLTFTDTVVVSGSRVEEKVIDSPATISVITSDAIAVNPAQNFGDLLRAVPGVNVIQTSARDVNITSRAATNTLASSQLTLLDGRSIYLDFFGMVLWDFVPTNSDEIKQIEVVRGPASAVWGANAQTGIVNIITKSPREAQGTTLMMSGGIFERDCGRCSQGDSGQNYGVSLTTSQAPNDRWSYKLSAGYFNSDPFSRPTGTIPRIPDPRAPGNFIGGASYPADQAGLGTAFQNQGTSQPKVDLRIDNDRESGGRLTLQGGYAGTEGIIHTGIGPFDIQSGSYMAYGKAGYSQGGFKIGAFGNFVDAQAPNLLQRDPTTLQPVQLNFTTQTYDLELGYTRVVGGKHILSMGGNARRNNFDITIAPNSENRNEFGAYFQDEVFFGKFRIALGARVDKFGNIGDPVFSPRVSVMFKPAPDHAIRASFNRAFRSPSVINNYIELPISNPTPIDLRPLAALLPPPLRPLVPPPFLLTVQLRGTEIVTPRYDMREDQLDAFEVSYTGTFNRRTTFGLALYQNRRKDNINFTSLLPSPGFPTGLPGLTFYSPTNPARGITIPTATSPSRPIVLSPVLMGILAQVPPQFGGPIRLPETVFSYLNLGPIRDRGVEVSLDHAFDQNVSGFVNYSWQDDQQVLDAAADEIPYPSAEIALPPTHRVNAGINFNSRRFLGTAAVNYVDDALWADVLTEPFHGFTDSYTLVNASFGVKWNDGRVTTTVKCQNLLNEDVQQHVFGDILKRSVALELKFKF